MRCVRFEPHMRSLHDRDVVRLSARAHKGRMKLRVVDLFCGAGGFSHEARGDPESFERLHFFTAVTNGYVRFDYHGWHQGLFAD